ncbi:MAG: hypothetical protein ACRCT8_01645 [Lacipirellulaceae bacterium]
MPLVPVCRLIRPIALAVAACQVVCLVGARPALAGDSGRDSQTFAGDNVEVWACRFGDDWDVNYDNRPDRWTKVEDDVRPHYVNVAIEDSDEPESGRCLVVRPNGASARLSSPPIYVVPKFSYTLDLRVKTEGIEVGKARLTMEFQDGRGRPRQVEQTSTIDTGGKWIALSMKNHQPRDPSIERMVLHVDFDRGPRSDLAAAVSVADLRLFRLPSVRIRTGSAYNVYSDPRDVRVTCELSGILERNPEVRFQLLDATNKSIGESGVQNLEGRVISESKSSASEVLDGLANSDTGYEGEIEWKPPIRDHGFYRIRVHMRSGETGKLLSEQAVTIAVVPEGLAKGERGEFGWTLPDSDKPLSFATLQDLLPLAGVSLVKLPVWYRPEDEKRGDDIVRFAEQLAARDIEAVGVLQDPTELEENPLVTRGTAPIEGLISAGEEHWQPMIEHIITKLSLRIHYWQLGRDYDTSFVGYANLVERMQQVRNAMFRFGQDVRLGIGWRWDHAVEWDERPSWDFEQMSAKRGLTAAQLDKHLTQSPAPSSERWVFVEPPDNPDGASDGALDELERHQSRVRDFVEQIVVAKVHGVNAIFVADPFSGVADPTAGRCGVMNVDGSPGELLLPWRTCARLLGGARYLGQMTLPGGSKNWLFKRADGQVVMVLWNDDPRVERLYLGDHVRVVNVWGKTAEPRDANGLQSIDVGRMPQFVVGLHDAITAWRMTVAFEESTVPSVFGVAHANKVQFTNTFGQGVSGTAQVFIPNRFAELSDAVTGADSDEWRLEPRTFRWKLRPGEAHGAAFEATLNNASFGDQPVRVDFVVGADREYRFSVWRTLSVGQGDLDLRVEAELDEEGRLLVHQRLRALSGPPADFRCQLYAVGNHRKRAQVFQLGADIDKQTYVYQDGSAMIGTELKLKIEELEGRRVLIHRFVVPSLEELRKTAAKNRKGASPVTNNTPPEPNTTAGV